MAGGYPHHVDLDTGSLILECSEGTALVQSRSEPTAPNRNVVLESSSIWLSK